MERKMSRIIIALSLIAMIYGCSSKIIWGPDGVKEATNYNIREAVRVSDNKVIDKSYKPEVPDRWFTDGLKQITNHLDPLLAILMPKPVPVPPVPVPTPTPTPTPYPAPEPTPIPVPVPAPVASTVFSQTGNVITMDMNTLPGSMRKAGFSGRDNALFYAMTNIYRRGPGPELIVKEGDAELARLNQQRASIYDWFDREVVKVKGILMTYPALTVIAITNDAYDRLGCRLGPAIVDRLKEFGSRVQLGNVLPEP